LLYVPYYGGEFYLYDSKGIERGVNSLWFLGPSDFAKSTFGSIFLILFLFVSNILTLIIILTLSIVSIVEMKKYLKNRNVLFGWQNSIQPVSTQLPSNSTSLEITRSEREKAKERKHIYCVVFMCIISMLERVTVVVCNVYYLFSVDYIAVLLGAILDLVIVVGPGLSFFIFFHFNREFKIEILKMIDNFYKKLKVI